MQTKTKTPSSPRRNSNSNPTEGVGISAVAAFGTQGATPGGLLLANPSYASYGNPVPQVPGGIGTPNAIGYGQPSFGFQAWPSIPQQTPFAQPQFVSPHWTPQAYPAGMPLQGTTSPVAIPPCDVVDEGAEFVCQIDLPGVKPESLELVCSTQGLLLNAVREPELDIAALLQSERGHATYRRNVSLPEAIHPDQVRATLRDGVLTVNCRKVNPTEGARRVEIQR